MTQKHWIPFPLVRPGDRIAFTLSHPNPTGVRTGTIKLLNYDQRCAIVHMSGTTGARPIMVDATNYDCCLVSEKERRERNATNVPFWERTLTTQ